MSNGRHSYVAFYPSDWLAGTARMTRNARSVYHDICLYNWDKNRAAPPGEVALMVGDLSDGAEIIELLVAGGTLKRDADGAIYSERALAEAEKSFRLWERKSAGGRKNRKSHPTELEESCHESSIEPEPEPEPDSSVAKATAGKPASDPMKDLFDLGVTLLTGAGKTEKEARSLVGKWRKQRGDPAVMGALIECRTKGITEPVEWLQKRLKPARYVSKSGYEYKGDLESIAREAHRRADWSTYWGVKGDIKRGATD